ncbi:MAG: spore maturation protein [Myxococcus sp.]|nr:spore maturation protein [Myxococcus sp.]
MNVVFYGLVLMACVSAAVFGTAADVGRAAIASATDAVQLAIGLVGAIALFLGLMKIVEEAGGLAVMSRLIRPVMVRLFPSVPPDHPAMGAMVMNIAANALGLGNAATPFGLKAMKELDTLNTEKGTATNAMVLFLAINTSGVSLLPTGVIGLRAIKGSLDPAAIFPTTLMATGLSTLTAIVVTLLLARLPRFRPPESQRLADAAVSSARPKSTPAEFLPLFGFLGVLGAMVYGVYRLGEVASAWILPILILTMLTVGVVRGVKIYEVFVAGAREGFMLAVGIIPSLVAILTAVGMLRKSGGLGAITSFLGDYTAPLGMPPEVLPLALLRPLSGSGAFALTGDLISTHGPDTYIGQLASTLNGSMETTFYVLAVYFGSVGLSRTRHAVLSGLAADLMGVVGSVLAVRWLLVH